MWEIGIFVLILREPKLSIMERKYQKAPIDVADEGLERFLDSYRPGWRGMTASEIRAELRRVRETRDFVKSKPGFIAYMYGINLNWMVMDIASLKEVYRDWCEKAREKPITAKDYATMAEPVEEDKLSEDVVEHESEPVDSGLDDSKTFQGYYAFLKSLDYNYNNLSSRAEELLRDKYFDSHWEYNPSTYLIYADNEIREVHKNVLDKIVKARAYFTPKAPCGYVYINGDGVVFDGKVGLLKKPEHTSIIERGNPDVEMTDVEKRLYGDMRRCKKAERAKKFKDFVNIKMDIEGNKAGAVGMLFVILLIFPVLLGIANGYCAWAYDEMDAHEFAINQIQYEFGFGMIAFWSLCVLRWFSFNGILMAFVISAGLFLAESIVMYVLCWFIYTITHIGNNPYFLSGLLISLLLIGGCGYLTYWICEKLDEDYKNEKFRSKFSTRI